MAMFLQLLPLCTIVVLFTRWIVRIMISNKWLCQTLFLISSSFVVLWTSFVLLRSMWLSYRYFFYPLSILSSYFSPLVMIHREMLSLARCGRDTRCASRISRCLKSRYFYVSRTNICPLPNWSHQRNLSIQPTHSSIEFNLYLI